MRELLLIILLILSILQSKTFAKENETEVRNDKIEIYFKWNRYELLGNYRQNAKNLEKIDSIIISQKENIDSIIVISQSSPEGIVERNTFLARKRGESIETYLTRRYPDMMGKTVFRYESNIWKNLDSLISRDANIGEKDKSRLKKILGSGVNYGTMNWRLSGLPVYNYLLKNVYPDIRKAEINFRFKERAEKGLDSITPMPADTILTEASDTVRKVCEIPELPAAIQDETPEFVSERKTLFALKTNVLADLASIVNLEVEIPAGNHFSIAGEYVFPWWKAGKNDNRYCMQILLGSIEPRYYFKVGDEKMRGHFVGAYASLGKYDLQWDRAFNYRGDFLSFGLTYGYTHRFFKNINIEYSLSVGYAKTDYIHYQPSDDYRYLFRDNQNTGTFRYLGPTKAKISLIIPVHRIKKTIVK